MGSPSDWVIELNCFACGTRIDRWWETVAAEATHDQLVEISRRSLLSYWKEDQAGGFAPAVDQSPIPDEVVVRAPNGRALYRRTIIDEKIERWFQDTRSYALRRLAAMPDQFRDVVTPRPRQAPGP
jgi:hypothetical protein